MKEISNPSRPIIEPSQDRFSAEEGLRLIKAFEKLPHKADRKAVIAYAERLAKLCGGSRDPD